MPTVAGELKKAQKSLNKVVRPAVRKGSKALIGGGKMVGAMGGKKVGRKMSNVGRAGLAASKVKDLKSARTAIDKALKAKK